MCRCEMLDVDNSHLVKEKVTGSFRSAKGRGRGGDSGQNRETEREEKVGKKKNGEGGREDKRKRESGENLETPPTAQ